MISRLYRLALIGLRRSFSNRTRSSIASRWLRSAKRLMTDAEAMSPVPLAAAQPTDQKETT